MSSFIVTSTPQIQFPLRLSPDLTHRLNHVSSSTRIPKSTLGRIAIQTLLNEIEEKGITSVLAEISE